MILVEHIRRRRASRGFTLLELIVVVVILGVLSARALPKFLALGKEARIAKLQGLQATLQATANQLHSLCALQSNQCSEAYGHINAMPNGQAPHASAWGSNFCMQNGWPAPFDGYGIASGYVSISAALKLDGYVVVPYVGSSFERTFQIADAPDPSNCKVTYRTWIWGPGLTPTYDLTTTGC